MAYNFRNGVIHDVTSCANIMRDWFQETPWVTDVEKLERIAGYWSDVFVTERVWIAEENGCIIGFCAREDCDISALYVVPHARNLGIGKQLLDLAKKDQRWATVWESEMNIRSRRFFRREGFIEIYREFENYYDGVSAASIEHSWTKTI